MPGWEGERTKAREPAGDGRGEGYGQRGQIEEAKGRSVRLRVDGG